MSDTYGRDGHDSPPCPRAKVMADSRGRRWQWYHHCPWRGHFVAEGGYLAWWPAFKDAQEHMVHCPWT